MRLMAVEFTVSCQQSDMFSKKPKVVQVELSKDYKFMYENFVFSTQSDTYLFLNREENHIDALRFNSTLIKYGFPNDEARGASPLTKYGLGFYGFYEVVNSPWVKEQMLANRVHPSHSDSLFKGKKHYVACFKDVMLEITCRGFEEIKLSESEVSSLVQQQIEFLDEQATNK